MLTNSGILKSERSVDLKILTMINEQSDRGHNRSYLKLNYLNYALMLATNIVVEVKEENYEYSFKSLVEAIDLKNALTSKWPTKISIIIKN